MARTQVVWLDLTLVLLGCLSPGVDSEATTQGINVSESPDGIPVTNMAPTISTDTWHVNASESLSVQKLNDSTGQKPPWRGEASSQSPTAVFTDTRNTPTPTGEASSQSPTAVFTDTQNTPTPTAPGTHGIPTTHRVNRRATTTKEPTTAKRAV
ncbi:uncharacterized protein LOC144673064 [Cetorhinus maximus]